MNQVRYVGFLNEPSGFGAAARSHALALAGAGIDVVARSVRLTRAGPVADPPHPRRFHDVARLAARDGAARCAIVQTPAHHFPLLRDPSCPNIGFTAWETDVLPPNWVPGLAAMDAMWVPSDFSAAPIRRATRRPVFVIPHPVRDPTAGDTRSERDRRCFPDIDPDAFVFAAILEWSDRKNPDGLIRAFCTAFRGRDDVVLLLKAGVRFGADRRQIVSRIRRMTLGFGCLRAPRVVLVLDDVAPSVIAHIHARADAYVSLHRAEGFGLCMAEAMAAGKPVVATAYSANMEFMDASCAFLVDYRMVTLKQKLVRYALFASTMQWAEPMHDAAVAALRSCVDEPAKRQRLAARGRDRVRLELAPQRIGKLMRSALEPFLPG